MAALPTLSALSPQAFLQGPLGLTLKTPPSDFTKPLDHWNYSREHSKNI